jgi:hypothetical protein
MKTYKDKKARKVRKEIEAYFSEGGRLTIANIIVEYFNPGSPFASLMAREAANRWVMQMTTKFNKMGRMFGRLNPQGEYGFAKNEEEAMYIGTRAYMITKGHIVSSSRKLANGQRQKLLRTKVEQIQYSQPVLA